MMKDICKDFQSICLFVLCLFFTACIPENIELPVASAPAEAIDLGLSVKWASYNVGANSPEEYGGYFAWGETKIKSNYAESTSVTYGLSESELKSLGIIGSDGNLTAAYDAATVNWGSAWRMPTLDEVKELLDKCSWQWTTVNGIYGQKVTGPNGNSIFLPAAGRRNGTEVSCYRGSSGYYWSGTQDESYSVSAYVLYFYRDNLIHIDGLEGNDFYYRNRGFSVRPVTEAISVTTSIATDITASGVTLLGSIANATQSLTCGVIYGTSSALSSTSGTMKSTTSDGDFSLSLTGLSENTTYYYRAYVVVDGEYRYGEIRSFTTKKNVTITEGEAIDLGLSVKWASCNVGASVPEGYGGYYAWGETEEKSSYIEGNYKYYNSCTDYLNIGSNISGTSYDVAHVKRGGGWRMPTLTEMKELCNKCSWEWTTVNGINGQKVTGPNGNSIFLPAAGRRYGTEVNFCGSRGSYWSGTLLEGTTLYAYCLNFNSNGYNWDNNYVSYRHVGLTVRPVIGEGEVTISVTTGTATDITASGATLSGSIANATQPMPCGVIYGISPTLSSTSGTMKSTTSDGDFSLSLTGLSENTTYYYRAYVVVDGEYRYGEICSFKTEQNGGSVVAEAVDLGLSVKWASCNVSANSPEEYGGYYAWGETEEKSNYEANTYKYYNSSTGYTNIGSDISGTSYDVARVKWGGDWRMPTKDEIKELCEKCSWEWTSVNGVVGQKVTGSNGNSIFFPAAGYRGGTEVYYRGSDGYYWSGTLSEDYSNRAYYLHFNGGHGYWNFWDSRNYGLTVRPVTGEGEVTISVTTGTATDITASGATLSGSIANATQPMPCGIVYGTSPTLSSTSGTIVSTTSDDDFSLSLIGLNDNTTYYYRAYVVVDGDYKYGDILSFQTKSEVPVTERAIDLGLSVKWGSCNVGAEFPEDYGGYYAWGETEEKNDYSSSTSITYGLSTSELKSQGIIDSDDNLTAAYDAATANWGSSWRMPTKAEIEELIDKCSWQWTTVNGVNGQKVTGFNGNSIFLPAAGCRLGTEVYYRDSVGYYWSGSRGEDNDYNVFDLYFGSDGYLFRYARMIGHTVRPVTD